MFTFRNGLLKSTDDGQHFQAISPPVTAIFADPNRPGHLLGNGTGGIFESTDDGVTWTLQLKLTPGIIGTDWANGFLYAESSTGIQRISMGLQGDLKTVTPFGPPGASAQTLVVVNGRVYLPNTGSSNVFVAKLDPTGIVVYATYFGGSGIDSPTGMTVDPTGNVYVTGTTRSVDFPTTKGTYSSTPGSVFLFKLNPDGSVGYSTYFPSGSSTPAAVAVDSAGSAYITGSTLGGFPTTPGAYQSVCACGMFSTGFAVGPQPDLVFFTPDAFLTKFDPSASTLVYSTYLGVNGAAGKLLSLGSDGSAYIASGTSPPGTIYRMNATGSSLLATASPHIGIRAMALAPDGSLYLAGPPFLTGFTPTTGAFQTTTPPPALPGQSSSPAAIVKMDAQLKNTIAATYSADPMSPSCTRWH